MSSESLGANFSIDITNLKAGLTQANRLIRESESEFKAAAAGMDDWSSSSDGLTAKIKSLNEIADLQQKKVDALSQEYERLIADGMDPTSKEAVELRTKINNETAALEKSKAEIEKQEQALDDLTNGTEEAAEATDEAGNSFEGLKAAGSVAATAVTAVAAAAVAAVGAFLSLAESTRESRNEMAKLETSFQTAGLSADDATNTFSELYGIMGDEGAAVEAAQQLAKISENEKDLEANTRILTGVMAEYGNSIPLEGLAEGIASSAAMSSVQGPLADALEWQGVNLETYNEKLESLSTEEERAAYIQKTLTSLYGESADAYRENNAEIIAANKAQAELNAAMNELGAIAEPIMTTLKTLAADLLTSITPFVGLIGDGLAGALNGADDAAENFADGLTGIVDTAVTLVSDLLPTVTDIIAELIPSILSSILSQVPTLLSTVLNIGTQLIGAISRMLPQLLTQIATLLPQIVTTLIAFIPTLLSAAIDLLMAIVDALPTVISALVTALPDVIDTLCTVLLDSIPLLTEAAVDLLMSIVEAIPTIIDALIANLPQIIETIISAVLNALPQLLDAAITLLFAIIDAIPTIVSSLSSSMPKIITAILTAVKNAVPQLFTAAKTLFTKIIDAISDLVRQLPSKMSTVVTAIVNGLKNGISSIRTIGQDIIKGLWNGISDMASWIKSKIQGFGEGVLQDLKDFFGIESPSRLMADVVGKNLALGIGEGFEDAIGDVNKEITASMNFASGDVGNGLNTAKSGLASGVRGVTVNQTNYYAQTHSRRELWQSKQDIQAAVKLAAVGV